MINLWQVRLSRSIKKNGTFVLKIENWYFIEARDV